MDPRIDWKETAYAIEDGKRKAKSTLGLVQFMNTLPHDGKIDRKMVAEKVSDYLDKTIPGRAERRSAGMKKLVALGKIEDKPAWAKGMTKKEYEGEDDMLGVVRRERSLKEAEGKILKARERLENMKKARREAEKTED